MRIYISGKITGTKGYQRRFKKAEKKFKGFTVINPAKISKALPKLKWHEYMRIDLKALELCDVIYMMKSWEESKGAQMEREYAIENGIDVMYE